jgi:hypothetical protein
MCVSSNTFRFRLRFSLGCDGSVLLSVPVVRVAIILLVGETLRGFQLEDHKVSRMLVSLFRPAAAKHGH